MMANIERDAELLWRFWVREHGGDRYVRWAEVRVKDEWRKIAALLDADVVAAPTSATEVMLRRLSDALEAMSRVTIPKRVQ